MNPLESATPEEAVNLEPLTRFRYRKVEVEIVDELEQAVWFVMCGHRHPDEYEGYGKSLIEAIHNAGIDFTCNESVD